jgi:phosphoglycerate dehydrogenase-like enzyme
VCSSIFTGTVRHQVGDWFWFKGSIQQTLIPSFQIWETIIKAVLHYSVSEFLRERLQSQTPKWLDLVALNAEDRQAFEAEIHDAEVLLHVLVPVDASMMASAPRLRLIQKIGVGVDAIDRDAAARRGIAVATMPGTNSQAVAEMTLGLILAVLRRIAFLDQATRRGTGWRLDPGVLDRSGEVSGRTVGFLGFGAIPRILAPVLRALGARIVYHDLFPAQGDMAEWKEFDALIEGCDILSLHAPLAPETRSIINARAFSRMRPGCILINTARGGLVDEAALVDALQTGRLAGAGLDTFENEPISPSSKLLGCENVIVTPHVAWLTTETIRRSLEVAFENCARLRDGRPILNLV